MTTVVNHPVFPFHVIRRGKEMRLSFPNRVHQFVLIASTLLFSWLAMQAVHELGHVLHAWASGGTVTKVLLVPLEISRTDVSPNPHPQFVAWGGPIWGALLPACVWF